MYLTFALAVTPAIVGDAARVAGLSPSVFERHAMLVTMLLGVFCAAMVVALVGSRVAGFATAKPLALAEALRLAVCRLPHLMALGVVSSLVCVGMVFGVVFLVTALKTLIPGGELPAVLLFPIYLAGGVVALGVFARLRLAPFVMVFEKRGVLGSLQRSNTLVRGRTKTAVGLVALQVVTLLVVYWGIRLVTAAFLHLGIAKLFLVVTSLIVLYLVFALVSGLFTTCVTLFYMARREAVDGDAGAEVSRFGLAADPGKSIG